MIISLSFKNFYSFADEVTIDFENPKAHLKSELYAVEGKYHLSKALMLVGANASGKSNVLKAFAFVTDFIVNSFSNSIKVEDDFSAVYFERHFSKGGGLGTIDKNVSKDQHDFMTIFELNFILDSKEYRYVLHLEERMIFYEALYVKHSQKPTCVFERKWDNKKTEYSYHSGKDFEFQESLGTKTSGDVSIISMANQHDVLLAKKLVKFFSSCAANIDLFGIKSKNMFDLAKIFSKDVELFNVLKKHLRTLDLGLDDIIVLPFINHAKNSYHTIGVHKVEGQEKKIFFEDESRGTQKLYALLAELVPVLNSGGLAIIDELDSELHVDMLDHILRLFFNKETNPHNAQIIFTSHILEPMNMLDKQQIILVEKNKKTLSSDAWKISDIQGLHPEENIYKKYKAGAYGAVPQFD